MMMLHFREGRREVGEGKREGDGDRDREGEGEELKNEIE